MVQGTELGGVEEVLKRMHTIRGEFAIGTERGLQQAGDLLLRKSQPFVPVDTGALKKSGFEAQQGHGFQTKIKVGYAMFYAIYVHEDLEARHAPGTYAKYLETPAYAYRDQMFEIIRREAKKRKGAPLMRLPVDSPYTSTGERIPVRFKGLPKGYSKGPSPAQLYRTKHGRTA